jgi:1-aminocyclopropane-1-carboxylate deaminase
VIDHNFKLKQFYHNNKHITILEDFHNLGSIGTKLRKIEPIFDFNQTKDFEFFPIVGNPNSNFIAAFSLISFLKKKKSVIFGYSKSNYKNGNYILTKNHAYKLNVFERKEYALVEYKEFLYKTNSANIPEFGICLDSSNEIDFLWKDIEQLIEGKDFYIDVGSGLTYLSALRYFRKKKQNIIGICIGLPKIKMVSYLNILEQTLYHETIGEYNLISNLLSSSFGSVSQTLSNFINEMFHKNNLFLEPIYSAKSMYTILNSKEISDKKPLVYLHQGGLISGVRFWKNN